MVTPDQLVTESLKGKKEAQRKLVEVFGPKLLVVCKRYSSSGIDAHDIFQEAWIKIFGALKQFDPKKGDFEGWIYRITVNEALKLIRSNLKNNYQEDVENPVIQSGVAEDATAISNLGYKELLALVAQLPEWQKLVFNLNVIEGYNHNEIGERLGISPSTSRSQLTRAKQKLRDLTQQYYG